MAKWVIAAKKADFKQISESYGISQILARIIRNREVMTDEEIDLYLNGNLNNLHDPSSMTDIVKAANLITEYIGQNLKFRIIGDYDIDGICSTYILLRGLRACGADVDYAIPHRIMDGYGLNENLVKAAYDDGRQVIITCDNGISAYEQIEYANSLGIHVIITDHHEVPELMPLAEAVVDPHREGDAYPFPDICGACVAWKLMQILLPMSVADKRRADKELDELLEEVAIATVGDVMELKNENRIIVKEGLRRLSDTSNVGLQALIRATGLKEKEITAYHIGFVIGPCLNASGRLDRADRALELLLCENEIEAAILANELKALNEARKSLTEQGIARAVEDIENSEGHVQSLKEDKVLLVYLPDTSENKGIMEGIIGIIAGRLRERYEKPVLVFTDAAGEEKEPIIKGSGRSVDAYNMYEELASCKELYTKFGGHKMAAGLSMSIDNLDELRRRLNDRCELTEEDLATKTVIDIELPFAYANESLINELRLLEPFGNGNSKPVFAQRGLKVNSVQIIGKNRNVLICKISDSEGIRREVKVFNRTEEFLKSVDSTYGTGCADDLIRGEKNIIIDILYYPGINEFRGQRSVEYYVNDYRFK